jgi:C4-type Zn-finger protein
MGTKVYGSGDDADIISKLYQLMKNNYDLPYIKAQDYIAVRCHYPYCSNRSIWILSVHELPYLAGGNIREYHLRCLSCGRKTQVIIRLEADKVVIQVEGPW